MAAPSVTPVQQMEMRTNQRKSLKKGRKPKKGKNGKGKSKLVKKKSKRNVLKAKAKAGKKTGSKQKTKSKAKKAKNDAVPALATPIPEPMPEEKPGKKQGRKPIEQPDSEVAKPKCKQERVYTGKGWMYRVTEGQLLGCSACRFIFNGCKVCRSSKFKGKSAAQMLLEQQGSTEGKARKARKVKKGNTLK